MRLVRGAALLAAAFALLPSAPASADGIRERQYGFLQLIEAEKAWRTTRGAGVTVAVVDSGVDPLQADLAGSVVTGPDMIKDADRGTKPKRLHGTGMASLIAGHGHGPGNGSGVIGLAPQAKILAIRVLAEPEDAGYARYRSTEASRNSVAQGVRYAADHGADVINLSLGRTGEAPAERAAIAYAISKGVVVVSAVGNDGDKLGGLDQDGFAPYSYPASYPGVIAVAATTDGRTRAEFSNRNYSALVAAPGEGLTIAGPGKAYFVSAGTSDASAVVSGIAALIRSEHRGLAPALVAQALVQSAQGGGRYSPDVGYGEVGAARALAAAARLAGSPPQTGKRAAERFGGTSGPVAIIDRPAWMKPVMVLVIVGGVGGAAAGVLIALTLLRRHPRPTAPTMAPQFAMSGPPPTTFQPQQGPTSPPPNPPRAPANPPPPETPGPPPEPADAPPLTPPD
ncbi:S8 family serine peptidase [Actinomadura rayongensis]|uniref:S8 family serine peptidase n=1 Tax=Actinomadura rayongensis TaxID=1429076 RepID=UPI0019283E33|nr:S8 family serine peptidase [Actinomadura rayongensis]